MDTSFRSFQHFAGDVLDLDLPQSSTVFQGFEKVQNSSEQLGISTIVRMTNKIRKATIEKRNPELKKNASLQAPPHKYFARSLTTIMTKNVKKVIATNKFIARKPTVINTPAVPINKIIFRLNAKLKPRDVKYNVKQMKSQTLVYMSSKGSLQYKLNPVFKQVGSKKQRYRALMDSSDQLLVSTENTLSDSYYQSIRIQEYIRRKEAENNLDPHIYQSLTNKLSMLNQSITNEQSRIARSFYSL